MRIEFDGKIHEFPDDFTDEDIAAALSPPKEPLKPFIEVGPLPRKQGLLPLDDKHVEPDPLPDLRGVDELSFDTETTGLRWWGIDRPVGLSLAWRQGHELRSCYLPWGHRGGGNHPEAKVREWVKRELAGKRLRGLNIKFDINQMRAAGMDLADLGCRFNDVGHNAALLDDARKSFSLEAIAQDELGEGKLDAGDPELLSERPAWQVAEYARRDAELVERIHERQLPRLHEQELIRVLDLEDSVIPATCEMEWNGARIDVEKLRLWEKQSQRDLEALLMRLRGVAGFHVHPSSPSDLTRLFGSLGIHNPYTTDTGAPSYTDAVLSQFTEHEAIRLVREAGHLEDLRSKFIVPYARDVRSDGILRFALNQLRSEWGGTVSGRYSSSQPIRGEGANIQQVMSHEKQLKMYCAACRDSKAKDLLVAHYAEGHPQVYIVRELYIPGEGMLLLGSDAKQIEYRVFAHMANSRAILDVYAKDPEADFHQVVCDMVQQFRPGFSRKNSKNLNFALLFGAGIKKTAEMLGIEEEAAREMRDAYFAAFPEAKELMDLASKTARTRGFVRTVMGRRTRFAPCPTHGYQGSRRPCLTCPRIHKALNGAVQGSAADVNKVKLRELYRERKRLGLTMRMTIHDEFVGDVPDKGTADEVARLLDRQDLPFRVPILWDTRTARNWAEAK